MVPCLFQVLLAYVFLIFFFLARDIHGQQDFLSIDCGMLENQSYIDPITSLTYFSDDELIDIGSNYTIHNSDNFTQNKPMQTSTVRSFPDGNQNCYQIGSISMGNGDLQFKIDLNYKYIIRAFFLYGNYDGMSRAGSGKKFQFELYLGVNFWKIISIEDDDSLYIAEIITLASTDYFMVCLINTGDGTPFISALELRRINDTALYREVNSSYALVYSERYNLGYPVDDVVRYPIDEWDRIWLYCNADGSSYDAAYDCPTLINTIENVQQDYNDQYQVPLTVMQSAWYEDDILMYHLDATNVGTNRPTFTIYLHFAELKSPSKYGKRIFDLKIPSDQNSSDIVVQSNISPIYLKVTHLPFTFEISADKVIYFNLTTTSNSDLPPMLNAAEIYIQMSVSGDATDPSEVVSMMTIRNAYKMRKWQGDPCRGQSPWANITCTDVAGTPSKITSLNFSSLGLTGGISFGFENLTALQNLDLSNNNLTGPIPEFLGELPSLKSLNISRNKFTGTIPSILLQRQRNGSLQFRWDNNPFLSVSDKNNNIPRKRNIVIASAASAIVVIIVIFSVVSLIWRKQKRARSQPERRGLFIDNDLVQSQCRRFSYEELLAVTNEFKDVIGEGGFGKVYHGVLDDGIEVAVKLRSFISRQGAKEFQNEAWLLSRVHHRNMVRLIGYCDENNSLALVYDFMANGSLKEHLSGRRGRTITWRKRLIIALESAQGLEYLHKGCTPPIIHRDVKSSNILLSKNFNAKISDFGLSKAFLNDDQTHISATIIVGTPGYLDPEYARNYKLTEKSDVYAFGVVLLELITGLAAILPEPETVNGNCNLVDWVNFHLGNGSMDKILDNCILNESDPISVNKSISLAMLCTDPASNRRPTMSEVVIQLKEIIGTYTDLDTDDTNIGSSSERKFNVSDGGSVIMSSSMPWDSYNDFSACAGCR
ncbi:hypothetical protein LUZ60_002359 [Juncus effusus]|nr:hypothetical protein LUZ60_002359 [Juncus effusus]